MLETVKDWSSVRISANKNGTINLETNYITRTEDGDMEYPSDGTYTVRPTPEKLDPYLYLVVPAHVTREAFELMREADVDVSVLEH